MNGFFWKDMKRSFLNVGFFAGMAAVAALLTAAVVTGTPPERIRSSYYILFNVFGASGFGPFAAVFPVLAYAARFCEEYQSGYYRMIFSRMSPVRFGRILHILPKKSIHFYLHAEAFYAGDVFTPPLSILPSQHPDKCSTPLLSQPHPATLYRRTPAPLSFHSTECRYAMPVLGSVPIPEALDNTQALSASVLPWNFRRKYYFPNIFPKCLSLAKTSKFFRFRTAP